MTLDGINQLSGDPNPVSGPLNASLQHVANTQLLTHLLDLYRFFFVSEGRISGDHKHPWYLGKSSDDFLGHPVAEEFLLWVITHVHEWQHSNRRHLGQGESHLILGGR